MLIRHDYKRACYRAMLSEFSNEEVKEFFSNIPLEIDGRVIKGVELYRLLWDAKGKIPCYWDCATDNLIERFLTDKGRDVPKVLEKILWLNNKSTYIPGKILLTWFYPKLEGLFDSLDTRDMVFMIIPLFTENYLPGVVHRRFKRYDEGDTIVSIMVFISDTKFNEYLDWELEFIAGPQVLNAPCMFGMPPFEGFGMISDTRPPEKLVWVEADRPVMDGDKLKIRGEIVGRAESFNDFCKRHEYDLGKWNPPDLLGVVMDKEYVCPVRKRVILTKGCFYGAPLFLHWVKHRRLNKQPKGLLKHLISDLAKDEELASDELEKKHRALLASLSERTVFKYYPSDESLSLNGQHFVRNIPAKIMRTLLSAYVKDGKTEFEYREFKRDFEISLGQKNSNFEVRFYRLEEKLKEKGVPIAFEKTGRGKFCLKMNGELEFSEEV